MAGSLFYGCIFGFLLLINIVLAVMIILTRSQYTQCTVDFSVLCPISLCDDGACPSVVCPEKMDCSFITCGGKSMATIPS